MKKITILIIAPVAAAIILSSCAPMRVCPTYLKNTSNIEVSKKV